MKFCEVCHNILETITDLELSFRCNKCLISYKSKPDDTLRFEEIKNNTIYDTLINTAKKDPTVLKEFNKCNECGHNISKQVRVGEDLLMIRVCEKCGYHK